MQSSQYLVCQAGWFFSWLSLGADQSDGPVRSQMS